MTTAEITIKYRNGDMEFATFRGMDNGVVRCSFDCVVPPGYEEVWDDTGLFCLVVSDRNPAGSFRYSEFGGWTIDRVDYDREALCLLDMMPTIEESMEDARERYFRWLDETVDSVYVNGSLFYAGEHVGEDKRPVIDVDSPLIFQQIMNED